MRRFGGIIVGIAALLAGMSNAAEVFYVDRDFQGENPTGRSWLSAFPTIQQAIDAAAKDSGEVWVKAGVYKPASRARSATFRLKPGVALYGGFRGNESERSQRNARANRTVLSGDIGHTGMYFCGSASSWYVSGRAMPTSNVPLNDISMV